MGQSLPVLNFIKYPPPPLGLSRNTCAVPSGIPGSGCLKGGDHFLLPKITVVKMDNVAKMDNVIHSLEFTMFNLLIIKLKVTILKW